MSELVERKDRTMSRLGNLGAALVDVGTVVAVGCVTMSVGVLVAFNIARSMPDDPIWPEMRCWAGISFQGDEQCFAKKLSQGLSEMEKAFELQKVEREKAFQERERELDTMIQKRNEEIAALEGRGKELEAEKGALDRKQSELADQLSKLEALEKASTSFNMFKTNPFKRGLVVNTGVEYKSFVRNQEWVHAWCYVHVPNSKGVQVRVTLATKLAGAAVEKKTVSAAELAETGFTSADVDEAVALCAFPEAES